MNLINRIKIIRRLKKLYINLKFVESVDVSVTDYTGFYFMRNPVSGLFRMYIHVNKYHILCDKLEEELASLVVNNIRTLDTIVARCHYKVLDVDLLKNAILKMERSTFKKLLLKKLCWYVYTDICRGMDNKKLEISYYDLNLNKESHMIHWIDEIIYEYNKYVARMGM